MSLPELPADHWPQHEWASDAVRYLDEGLPADVDDVDYVAPNGDWFEPYPAPFAQGIIIWRAGDKVTMSGMWRNKFAGTFPDAGIMGAVPAWARSPYTSMVLGLCYPNVPVRVDIQKTDGALILRKSAGIVADGYVSLCGSYLLAGPNG